MWSCPALQQRLRFACVDFTLEYPVPLLSFSLQLVDFSVKLGSCFQQSSSGVPHLGSVLSWQTSVCDSPESIQSL